MCIRDSNERITRLQKSTDKHNEVMTSTTTRTKRSIDSTLTESTSREQPPYDSPAKRPLLYKPPSNEIESYEDDQDYRYEELMPRYTLKDNPEYDPAL